MTEIKCLAQGSSGNSWVLDHNGKYLILDAGIGVKEIKRGIDYNLMGVQGVCVTHPHV